MKQVVRISQGQLIFATALFQVSGVLIFLPAPMVKAARQDAWLAVWLGVAMGGLTMAVLMGLLARHHPQLSLAEMAERTTGRFFGKFFSLLFLLFTLFLTHLIVRINVDFASLMLLQGTPQVVTGLMFIAVVAYAAYSGGEVIVRLSLFSVMAIIISSLLLPIGLLGELQIIRLRPVFAQGFSPLWSAAWITVGWFAESLPLIDCLALLQRPEEGMRALMWGNLIAAALLTLLIALTLALFGPNVTQQFLYPTYALAQEARLGEFLTRFDTIMLCLWIFGQFCKASLCLWSSANTTRCLLGLRDDRWSVLPLAGLVLGGALLWKSGLELMDFDTRSWTPLTLPFTLGLPTLLWLLSWWRKSTRRVPR